MSSVIRPQPQSRAWPTMLAIACGLLAGCTSTPRTHLDYERATLLLARGHFEQATLHEWDGCDFRGLPDELVGVINCVAVQSRARFALDEVLAGPAARRHIEVGFWWGSLDHEPVKVGASHQYLAVMLTDGAQFELQHFAPVFRTRDRRWAIALRVNEEDEELAPCLQTVRSEPAPFVPGVARERLSDLELNAMELDELRANPAFEVRGKYVHAHRGAYVDTLVPLYTGLTAEELEGRCCC